MIDDGLPAMPTGNELRQLRDATITPGRVEPGLLSLEVVLHLADAPPTGQRIEVHTLR